MIQCHEFFLKLVVLDKIPKSPFLEFAIFVFGISQKIAIFFTATKTKIAKLWFAE